MSKICCTFPSVIEIFPFYKSIARFWVPLLHGNFSLYRGIMNVFCVPLSFRIWHFLGPFLFGMLSLSIEIMFVFLFLFSDVWKQCWGKCTLVSYTWYSVMKLGVPVLIDRLNEVYKMAWHDWLSQLKYTPLFSLSETCAVVFVHRTFEITRVHHYICFNLLAKKNPLNSVDIIATFYCLGPSGKYLWEAELNSFICRILKKHFQYFSVGNFLKSTLIG